MWEEAVMVYFKVIFQYSYGGTLEVLKIASIKIVVFWDMILYTLVDTYYLSNYNGIIAQKTETILFKNDQNPQKCTILKLPNSYQCSYKNSAKSRKFNVFNNSFI
jgi:hypothetical protein